MIGTLAVPQFFRGVKPLAAETIEPFIPIKVDVICVIHLLEKLLHVTNMVVIGCADEMVVGDVTGVPRRPKRGTHPIGKLLWADSCVGCGLGDLVAMFICAGEVEGVPSSCTIIASESVSDDHGVGTP